MSDDVIEGLDEYITQLSKIKNSSYQAIKEVVDEEARRCYEDIKEAAPRKTGGLQNSLAIEREQSSEKYGWSINFKGYSPSGKAYQYIANTLNRGTLKIRPLKFIDKAVLQLKGLDDRIMSRFEKKIQEIDNGN